VVGSKSVQGLKASRPVDWSSSSKNEGDTAEFEWPEAGSFTKAAPPLSDLQVGRLNGERNLSASSGEQPWVDPRLRHGLRIA
jgi:hypothetical protein